MSRLRSAALLLGITVLLNLSARGDMTLILTGGTLRHDNGADLMPLGGLFILVASTTNDTFSGPTPTSFVNDDDIVLAKFTATVDPGTFSETLAGLRFSDHPGWKKGNPLQLYWYPNLTLANLSPGTGTGYGRFRSDSILDSSDIPWITPADAGGTFHLDFRTLCLDGSNPNAVGWANLVVASSEPDGDIQDSNIDSQSHGLEIRADNVPTVESSPFALRSVTLERYGTRRITWSSVPGKTYQVLYAEGGLSGAWQVLAAPLTATGEETSLVDDTPISFAGRLYRVKLVD